MLLMFVVVSLVASSSAWAAPAGPGWSIRTLAQPTNFSSKNNTACGFSGESESCDNYTIIVTNVGGKAVAPGGHVTIADSLPSGVDAVSVVGSVPFTRDSLACSKVPVQCVDEGEVRVGETLLMTVDVRVDKALEEAGTQSVSNSATVSGGAPAVAISSQTALGEEPASFEIADFALQAFDSDGAASTQAGGHPYSLATSLYFTSENEYRVRLGGINYRPPEEVKDIIVDLPPGLVGNPQNLSRCPIAALLKNDEETTCPSGSRVGTLVFEASPGRLLRPKLRRS